MGQAAGKFGNLGHKNVIFITPVDDNFIFRHLKFSSQIILDDNRPDLSDLIYFCLRAFPLQIDFFFDSGFPEDMMAAALAFSKPKAQQQLPQIVKGNIGVEVPLKI